MENNIKNTICKKAWDYPIVNLSNNEISMCCHSKHHKISEQDITRLGKDIFTKFEPILQAKLDLLNGIQTENCSYCWQLENKGLRSSRYGHGFNRFSEYIGNTEQYKGKTSTELQNMLMTLTDEQKQDIATNIDYVNNVEIALGNTCDLKCIYCNEFFSSQWITEKIKYKEIPISFAKDVNEETNSMLEDAWWKWFNDSVSKQTTIIGFIGGEPLIINKLYEYVDKILIKFTEAPTTRPVYLSVITNFNTPEQYFKRFIELIPKISKTNLVLDLNISLEALSERTEFIRTGTKWERLTSNIEETLSLISTLENKKCVSFNFMLALNALCVSDLPKFFTWIIRLQRKYKVPINIRGGTVVYPKWLSTTILPPSYKFYVDDAIKILKSENLSKDDYLFGPWNLYINQLIELKNSIGTNTDTMLYSEFIKNIDQLSERRSLDFFNTFPEMIKFYNDCKKYE
jgi:hypothetical protein